MWTARLYGLGELSFGQPEFQPEDEVRFSPFPRLGPSPAAVSAPTAMSAQSGIGPAAELLESFAAALADPEGVRAIKVVIEGDKMVNAGAVPPQGGEEEDMALLEPLLDDESPAFLLYRLDAQGQGQGFMWMMISYVPDIAPVRAKMIHASSRSTLTKQLGDSHFGTTLFASAKDELSAAGYARHVASQNAAAPLTARERELANVHAAEGVSVFASSERSSHVWGGAARASGEASGSASLGLPWGEDALQRLAAWASGTGPGACQFVIKDEAISPSALALEGSPAAFPPSEPSYTFWRLAGFEQCAFIYACPPQSPVRSRLLYSSSAAGVASKAIGLGISVKKIETSDITELTEAYVRGELGIAPATDSGGSAGRADASASAAGFKKPARPGRR